MEQITKIQDANETRYRDVSEDAFGAGMEKTAWVRMGSHGKWIATRYWAGHTQTNDFDTRIQAEVSMEQTFDNHHWNGYTVTHATEQTAFVNSNGVAALAQQVRDGSEWLIVTQLGVTRTRASREHAIAWIQNNL